MWIKLSAPDLSQETTSSPERAAEHTTVNSREKSPSHLPIKFCVLASPCELVDVFWVTANVGCPAVRSELIRK